jgi:hypothetical protein
MLREYIYQIRLHRKSGTSYSQLRYFLKWKNSFKEGASSVKDEQPWITYDAISFLKNNITSTSKIFEYGGGGSTLFFTKRAAEVVTVEHNEEWYKLLSELIRRKGISNWQGNYVLPETGNLIPEPDISNPRDYTSGDIPSKDMNYRKYASSIDQFPPAYFDFILVDGRSRPSCMAHAIPKLKRGGFLILDNSDREYYLPYFNNILRDNFITELNNTCPAPYCREFTQTSIWKKK